MSSDETLKEIAERLRVEWGNKPAIDVDKYLAALVAALQQARDLGREEERETRILQAAAANEAIRCANARTNQAIEEERKAAMGIVGDKLSGFAVVHPAAMGAYQAIMSALDARSSHQGQCQGEQCLPNCSCACHARSSQERPNQYTPPSCSQCSQGSDDWNRKLRSLDDMSGSEKP